MKSATDEKLKALLERLRRLGKQLARTRADSAETRKFAEAVQRHIERARAALDIPTLPVGADSVSVTLTATDRR